MVQQEIRGEPVQVAIFGMQRSGTKSLERSLHTKLSRLPTYLGCEGGHALGELLHCWEKWGYTFSHKNNCPWGSPYDDTFYYLDPRFVQCKPRHFEPYFSSVLDAFSWREAEKCDPVQPIRTAEQFHAVLKNRSWILKVQGGNAASKMREVDLLKFKELYPTVTTIGVKPRNVPLWIASFWAASVTSAFDVVRVDPSKFPDELKRVPREFVQQCLRCLTEHLELLRLVDISLSAHDTKLHVRGFDFDWSFVPENSSRINYCEFISNFSEIEKCAESFCTQED